MGVRKPASEASVRPARAENSPINGEQGPADAASGGVEERRHSRRQVLGLGAMAAAGAAGAVLLRGGTAEAGHGTPNDLNALHLGETNDATTLPATRIESRAPKTDVRGALTVVSDDPVSGEPVDAAIFASTTNSLGVLAESVNVHGLLAISTNAPGIGVLSRTRHSVIANGTVKAGVLGYVPHGPFPFTPDGTGVHGHGPVIGVLGTSARPDGIAVSARSANGVGGCPDSRGT